MQTIIAYIIIGVAVGYMIYSIVKSLSVIDADADTETCTSTNLRCGGMCGDCRMKNIKNCSSSNYKYNV